MVKNFSLLAAAIGLATVCMFSVPGQVAAEWNDPGSVNPGTVEVAFIEVSSSGVYVSFKAAPFVTTCGFNGLWWRVGATATGATVDKLLTILQAAKLSGTKLKVYRPDGGACTGGTTGYPILSGLIMG